MSITPTREDRAYERGIKDALAAAHIENQDLRASLSEIKIALGLHQDSGVADCVDKIKAMTDALEWYASSRTWNQWLPDSAGERARKALEGELHT